jgi:ABC-type glycerol-3-phosphate transport system substrate-binding protein
MIAVTDAKRFHRRDFLFTSAIGGVACAVGCKPNAQPEAVLSSRTDVPLRVLICGDAAWGAAISTAWGGVAKQPLAIETLPLEPVADVAQQETDSQRPTVPLGIAADEGGKPSSQFARGVIAGLLRNDVAIIPCGVIADIAEADALMPLSDDLLESSDLAIDRFYPVFSESLMRWAGRPVAIPLGCLLPAMLTSVDFAANLGQTPDGGLPKTWQQFDEVLQRAVAGQSRAAEPLAGGAAAKMFLWRASEAAPPVWLFDRVTFDPVLTEATYVTTLEAMREQAQLYAAPRKTAGEVWNAFSGGDLAMAIAWPAASGDPPRIESIGDSIVSSLPRPSLADDPTKPTSPVLPDPDAPIAIISGRCRQTAAAKRFLTWLSGGDGTEMIRNVVGPMTQIRRTGDSDQRSNNGENASDYDAYLAQRLASLNLRPTIRLHAYDRYLAALDHHVLACLDGTQSAIESMQATADQWRQLTSAVGPERQAKAWRLAQGLRN